MDRRNAWCNHRRQDFEPPQQDLESPPQELCGEYSLSAFHYALSSSDECSTLFINNDVNLYPEGSDIPLLAFACFSGRSPEVIASLVDSHGNTRVKLGALDGTALHFSVERHDQKSVSTLLGHPQCISSEVKRQSDGLTPVYVAAVNGFYDLVLTLLQHGASKTIDSQPPLLKLLIENHAFECVENLLEANLISVADLESPAGSETCPIVELEQQNIQFTRENHSALESQTHLLMKLLKLVDPAASYHVHPCFTGGSPYSTEEQLTDEDNKLD